MGVRYIRALTATGDSAACVLDHYQDPFAVSIAVSIVGTSATYSVQYTLDDPTTFATPAAFLSSAIWFSHPTLSAQTTNQFGNLAFPVSAVKLTISAISAATVTMTALQAGPN
jgi:hypothetical protein